MHYAKFRLGQALLDDLYGPDRTDDPEGSGEPDDHKRLDGLKYMNGLGGPDKPDESIGSNNLKIWVSSMTRTSQVGAKT